MCSKCPTCKCAKEYYGLNDQRSHHFIKLESTLQARFDTIHKALEELHEKIKNIEKN